MRARDMVFVGGLLAFAAFVPPGASAQSGASGPDAWRAHFQTAEEARRVEDGATYAAEMAKAAEAMPVGHLNRPFVQYHAARGAAMQGRADDAVRWLRTAWDEEIESLMISFARFDPAFDALEGLPAFEEVLGLAAELELEVTPLGGSAHLLAGAGSNLVAQVGPDGVLLVDTGYAPALEAVRRALASLGADGVDLLVVTHPHDDHMGSDAALGAEATLLAHPGTEAAMREPYVFMEGVELPPKEATALPEVQVARDTTFTFNGERVRLVPTVAHTPGDVSVYFERSKMAPVGNTSLTANPLMFPGTEDAVGFLYRLEAFLDSMDPETVVVGGHESPTDLGAVRAQIETSRACLAFVESAIADGLTIEQTAERGAERFPVAWIAFFYGYLSREG